MDTQSYKSLKIIIADDHGVTRKGLAIFCQEAFKDCTIFECESIESLFKLLKVEKEIDLLILDIYFGENSSIQQIGVLKSIYDELKILVVSMREDEIYGVRAMREGVQGYVSKMSTDDEIREAIKTVITGAYYLSPKLKKISAGLFNARSQYSIENPFLSLSTQEFHVCLYLLKGHDIYKIADLMNLSPSTVSTYKCRVLAKLEVKKMNELIRLAVEYNIEHKTMM
jgi:DNA-binding NarL/FixJ family response regulator